MRALRLASSGERLSILCLGAHSDDIEIGVGATLLGLLNHGIALKVQWCVLSGASEREREARASATEFLLGAKEANIELLSFSDGFFPQEGRAIKCWFEELKRRVEPDVVFTHYRDDAHQDHREVCQLTWNTFRDHLILEYEIPKWDGDMGRPNLYVPIAAGLVERKIKLLMQHFGSQRSKQWFDADTFRGLARLRGVECRAPECYAEAFFARKLMLA